jgi:phage baseplate assembly protein W
MPNNPIKSFSAVVGNRQWIIDGAFQFDWTAPAGSVEEVLQNVWNIIVTPLGSQPLFRLFGSDMSWIDGPGNLQFMQARVAFLTALSIWEPRAKVQNISFGLDPAGVMAGVYSLSLVVEVDLSLPITQTLYSGPPPPPVWTIDGPIGGTLEVELESITV